VHGWGWYYVGGVLDDYSRYLLAYQVVADMTGPTLTDLVHEAVELTGMAQVPVEHKPVLLSDNGSGYISGPLNEYLDLMQIRHIFCAALHPQTIGKFERLNRTAQAKLGLIIYTLHRDGPTFRRSHRKRKLGCPELRIQLNQATELFLDCIQLLLTRSPG